MKYVDPPSIVTVTTRGPCGFYYVAQEISYALNIPLVELSGKPEFLNYFKPLHNRPRPSYIINVGTVPPKKLIIFSMIAKVIAYTVVEGPFPVPMPIVG